MGGRCGEDAEGREEEDGGMNTLNQTRIHGPRMCQACARSSRCRKTCIKEDNTCPYHVPMVYATKQGYDTFEYQMDCTRQAWGNVIRGWRC